MAFRGPRRRNKGEYLGHFLKFLATFAVIIGISLFVFSFTASAVAL